jgi:hypothetical protein
MRNFEQEEISLTGYGGVINLILKFLSLSMCVCARARHNFDKLFM